MFSLSLAQLRAHVARLIATCLAIVIEVGFVVATLVLNQTSKTTVLDSVGAQYSWDLPGGWGATLRGDYYRQTEQYARVYNTAYDKIEGWENVNLTLKVEKPEWGLEVDAYVKNLLNDVPIIDAYTSDDSSGLFTNIFLSEPRTYGMSVTKRF